MERFEIKGMEVERARRMECVQHSLSLCSRHLPIISSFASILEFIEILFVSRQT